MQSRCNFRDFLDMSSATFGPFVLDTAQRQLFEGARPVHLPLKSFELLEYLVRQAPRAVPRQELYDHLWGGTYVEEANLSNMISDLRGTLGDTRSKSKYVKTVHGFGYAFVGEVRWSASPGQAAATGTVAVLLWNGKELLLAQGENVIGRHASADIVVHSTGVSRKHAVVRLTGSTASIRDLGSKNGTFVGKEPAGDETLLADGNEIRLGTAVLTFRVFSDGDTTRTVV